MTHYGKVKSFDQSAGTGFIIPEKGGDALPFRKADMQKQNWEPQTEQRLGYETEKNNSGEARAVKLETA